MAWERRARTSRRYFYKSRRTTDGKVTKDYLGCGESADKAAVQAALISAIREADRCAVREEVVRLTAPAAQTAELVEAGRLLLEATLTASGFHRPNYGPWRMKRRGENKRNG